MSAPDRIHRVREVSSGSVRSPQKLISRVSIGPDCGTRLLKGMAVVLSEGEASFLGYMEEGVSPKEIS